jgi:hypothetical protein
VGGRQTGYRPNLTRCHVGVLPLRANYPDVEGVTAFLLHFDDDGLPVAVGRLDGHDVTASHCAFQRSMCRARANGAAGGYRHGKVCCDLLGPSV